MEIEAVLIRCGTKADVQRLRRAGGEVWQEQGQVRTCGITWRYWLVKVPAAAALRLGLVKLGDVADVADSASPDIRR